MGVCCHRHLDKFILNMVCTALNDLTFFFGPNERLLKYDTHSLVEIS